MTEQLHYTHYSAENMGNLCNFIGWMSGEADWGYSSLTCPAIDRSLYDKIADNDFRKYSFLDPAKYDFYDYKTSRTKAWIEDAPAYLSLKFRCAAGDYQTYSVGGAVDVPIMRVEEMYLILMKIDYLKVFQLILIIKMKLFVMSMLKKKLKNTVMIAYL